MKKLIITLFILLMTTQAKAFYIQDYTFDSPVLGSNNGFYDTRTGRTWLDLTYFMTYNEVKDGLIGTDFYIAKQSDMDELGTSLLTGKEESLDLHWQGIYMADTNGTGTVMGWYENGGAHYYVDQDSKPVFNSEQSDSFSKNFSDQAIGTWVVKNQAEIGTAVAPEPATWALIIIGMIGLALTRKVRFA